MGKWLNTKIGEYLLVISMRKRRFGFIVLAGVVALGLASKLTFLSFGAKETADSTTTQFSTTTIQSTNIEDHGLQFTLQTPDLTTTYQGEIIVAGLTTRVQKPGEPALPYYTTFIALPPEATATVQIKASNISTQFMEKVLSAPKPADMVDTKTDESVETAVNTSPSPLNFQPPSLIHAPDVAIYQKDALYPGFTFSISDPMYSRDLRLVELRIYPIQYNPVTKELQQSKKLVVNIRFEGAKISDSPSNFLPETNETYSLSDAILNFDQALIWRNFPQELIDMPLTNFPTTAANTYKIEIEMDGIYEISGADLADQGMNIAAVNPATIEMMHQGKPVAYQFIGNGNAIFEPTELVRFYGWAFDGPRTEKLFISSNVFWLWAGGTPTIISTIPNQIGGTIVTSTMTAVTKEPENLFTTTYTDKWDNYANEPDAWYWDYTRQGAANPLTKTYQISLTHPAVSGPSANLIVELFPRDLSINTAPYTYTVRSYINNFPGYGEESWTGKQSINITNTIPLTELVDQANDVHLVYASSSPNAELYLNRVTVEYWRQLIATDDQLIFSDENSGYRQFHVSGFTDGSESDALVWNVTNPINPSLINMAGNIIGSGNYTYTIGSSHEAGAKFIVTTITNTLKAKKISQYSPGSLVPPSGGADWIAISHIDFLSQADVLASHRANFSDIQTWVVNYEDVINQYGYGLPLPSAIRDFLAYSLGNWSPAPSYVTLFGAATYNPRNLDCQHSKCPGGLGTWDKDQPTFVVTDLVYKDRFQGLIPTDHTMVLLSGNDLLPDMAIGRITADTVPEADSAVAKIILYEQSQLPEANWQKNLLFVADNDDEGGNFHYENLVTVNNHIPGHYAVTQRFLVNDTITETNNLRFDMFNDVNGPGVSIINYRGHGSITRWASPAIISSDSESTDFWGNHSKPTVVLSADCLDGNFAFPGVAALSKTLLTLQSGGTPVGIAANWSATGLGLTTEHSVLHRSFYDGIFKQNKLTIGDATNYAKLMYYQGGWHESEMYAFLLQGDPAMRMFPMRYQTNLPTIQN